MVPEIGKTYVINYVDRDYPCRCPCHSSNGMMRHIMACCRDRSYSGPAKCIGRYQTCKLETIPFIEDYDKYWDFHINDIRGIILHESSIISEVT